MDKTGLTQGLIGIDTNVLARAVLHDDEQQVRAAHKLLGELTPECPGFVSNVTLVELYWVLARGHKYDKQSMLAIFRRLVTMESLEFEDGEGVVNALFHAENGADFADALIHETFQQFGTTRALSFDQDACHRFGWEIAEA